MTSDDLNDVLKLAVVDIQANDKGAREERTEMIRRTHGIFVGIHGKEIALTTCNPPGRTDVETFIAIPIEDPRADLVHKHEWQHILFRTDLRARAGFVDKYAERLLIGIPPSSQDQLRSKLVIFLHAFCNGLDDLRVASLWHRVYPHSAEEIEDRWRAILYGTPTMKNDIIFYMMAKGLGLGQYEIGTSPWDKYGQLFIDNTAKVKGMGFPAVLVTARVILDHIMKDVMDEFLADLPPPPQSADPGGAGAGTTPDPAPRASRLSTKKGSIKRPSKPEEKKEEGEKGDGGGTGDGSDGDGAAPSSDLGLKEVRAQAKAVHAKARMLGDMISAKSPQDSRFADTMEAPTLFDPNPCKTQATIAAALGVGDDAQINRVLHQAQKEMEQILRAMKAQPKQLSSDQRLLQGLENTVDFQDVPATGVLEQTLTTEDGHLIQTMKRAFIRLRDRKRRSLSDSGSTLDPTAFIDMLMGSDGDIFEDETCTRGFSALILLDMSGSMLGDWEKVARAAKVLAKSVKSPMTTFEVWGFSSQASSKATIFRFLDTEKGYNGPGVRGAWGMTPLQQALEVAMRRAEQMPGNVRHVFVLTDGMPTHIRADGSPRSRGGLLETIGKSVTAGRQQGVNVVGLVIGDQISDKDATRMFGHKRYWSRTDTDDLFKSMTELVERAFVSYLRGR